MPNGNQNEEYQQLLAYLQDVATGMVQNAGGDHVLFLANYALAIQTLVVELIAGNIETIPAIQALEQAVNQFLTDTVPGYSGPPGAGALPDAGPAPGPEPITPPPPATDPMQLVPPPASGAGCGEWFDWIDRYMAQVPTPAWPLPMGGSKLPPPGQAKCIAFSNESEPGFPVCAVSEWQDGTGANEVVLYRFVGPSVPILVDPLHRYDERLVTGLAGGGISAWMAWAWKREPQAWGGCPSVPPLPPPPAPPPPLPPPPEPPPPLPPPPEPCPPAVEIPPEPIFVPTVHEPVECCPPVDIDVPGFLGTLPIDQQKSILSFYGLERFAGATMADLNQEMIRQSAGATFQFPILSSE